MRVPVLLLLGVAVLSTPAAAQSSPDVVAGQKCSPMRYTPPPPAVGALVDSAAFAAALRAFSQPGSGEASVSLVGVSFDRNGRPERAEGYSTAGAAAGPSGRVHGRRSGVGPGYLGRALILAAHAPARQEIGLLLGQVCGSPSRHR